MASGLVLGFLGMFWVLVFALVFTAIGVVVLSLVKVDEKHIVHVDEVLKPKKIDIKGTLKVVRGVPGLMPLIIFTTINNFLGGVFMALMDAYGLSLVSVQMWGLVWGLLSLVMIVGGLTIAKFVLIPFMTDGAGVALIGSWFGVGEGRGIALVFMAAGVLGLILTTLAMRTKSYGLLKARYLEG